MVSLVKGQKVDLTKGNAGLKQIIVDLGWVQISTMVMILTWMHQHFSRCKWKSKE